MQERFRRMHLDLLLQVVQVCSYLNKMRHAMQQMLVTCDTVRGSRTTRRDHGEIKILSSADNMRG